MENIHKKSCKEFKSTMDYNAPYHKNFTSNCNDCVFFSYRNCQKGNLFFTNSTHDLI